MRRLFCRKVIISGTKFAGIALIIGCVIGILPLRMVAVFRCLLDACILMVLVCLCHVLWERLFRQKSKKG